MSKRKRYVPNYGASARRSIKDVFVRYDMAKKHLKVAEIREQLRTRAVLRGLIIVTWWEDNYERVLNNGVFPKELCGKTDSEVKKYIENEAEYAYTRDPFFHARIEHKYSNILRYMEEESNKIFNAAHAEEIKCF